MNRATGCSLIEGEGKWALVALVLLVFGASTWRQGAWGEDVPASVTCVKCCWANDDGCCCSRDGKETGKTDADATLQYVLVGPEDLPVSGYLASRECMVSVWPWSRDGIRECQGATVWIELRTEGDLFEFDYSYVRYGESEPYLVPMRKDRPPDEKVSWGRIKTMYR